MAQGVGVGWGVKASQHRPGNLSSITRPQGRWTEPKYVEVETHGERGDGPRSPNTCHSMYLHILHEIKI